MLVPLNEEEKRALRNLGVFDCIHTGQLVGQEENLRKQFRRQALSLHPDRAAVNGDDPEALTRKFQDLSDGYQLLMSRIMIQKGVLYRTERVKVRPPRETPPVREHSLTVGLFKGRLPDKRLRFAEFLYYTRVITWEQLIASLSWQFLNRPKMGELARNRGWMDNEQIIRVLRGKRSNQRFGLVAVNQGYLTAEQCRTILRYQKTRGLPIGKFFVDQNILTRKELQDKLVHLYVHNGRVG